MSTKYVIILLYDIPVATSDEKKKYQKFNKYTKSIQFIMLQESVYVMSINNKQRYQTITRDLRLSSPINSNIRSLLLTEKSFSKLDLISGEQTFKEQIISKNTRVLEL